MEREGVGVGPIGTFASSYGEKLSELMTREFIASAFLFDPVADMVLLLGNEGGFAAEVDAGLLVALGLVLALVVVLVLVLVLVFAGFDGFDGFAFLVNFA